MAALNVSALLDALASSHGDKLVREAVGTWLGAAPVKPKKGSKAKKEPAAESDGAASAGELDKPKRSGPDAWNAFINLVCGPKDAPTSGYSAWLEENGNKKGNKRFSYAKEMKGEDDRDYEAFKAEFKSTASSKSSVVSEAKPAKAEKPKKAKATAKKGAGAGAAAAGGGLVLSDSEEEVSKPKAKKAPAKAKKAALPPLPPSDDEESISKIELYDQQFFWDSDAGTLYEVKDDGSRGEIVGSYDGSSAHFC